MSRHLILSLITYLRSMKERKKQNFELLKTFYTLAYLISRHDDVHIKAPCHSASFFTHPYDVCKKNDRSPFLLLRIKKKSMSKKEKSRIEIIFQDSKTLSNVYGLFVAFPVSNGDRFAEIPLPSNIRSICRIVCSFLTIRSCN